MKIQSLVSVWTMFLICGTASTARSDITAFFTAGVGSTHPGVYEIDAATSGARGSLLIPSGGALSLTDPEGLVFIPSAGTGFVGNSNYSLLVSSYGTNQIVAYDLDGSPEGVFHDGVPSPSRMAFGRDLRTNNTDLTNYVYAIAGAGISPSGVVDKFSANGYLVAHKESDLTGNTANWAIGLGTRQEPLIGLTSHGVDTLSDYVDSSFEVDPFANHLAGEPRGLALGPFQELYVAEPHGNTGGIIEKFSFNGADLGTVYTLDPATNGLIEDIGFGPDGKLYVLEQDRLVRINIAVGTAVAEQTNAFPSGTVANSLLMSPNTFPGGVLNLVADAALLKHVKTNFPAAGTPGVTGVLPLDSATLHAMPGIPGVTLFDAVNLFSSAQFTGSLSLEFQFDRTMIPQGYSEGQMKLFAYDPDTGWQDITGFVNFDSNTISGMANSFETFAIGAATVPEPSSLVLGGLGVVGLFLFTRRSRKSSGGSPQPCERKILKGELRIVDCQRAVAGAVLALLILLPISAGAVVINIDATQYGHSAFDGFSPAPGGNVVPFGPGGDAYTGVEGSLNQIVLGAGTYSVTNAAGEPTATFSGWNYDTRQDQSTDPSWVWDSIIAIEGAYPQKLIISTPSAGSAQASLAAIATLPAVQNFYTTFTLANTSTLDFMVNDYGLSDNAGGVSLDIQRIPEPSTLVLACAAAVGLFICIRHRSNCLDC